MFTILENFRTAEVQLTSQSPNNTDLAVMLIPQFNPPANFYLFKVNNRSTRIKV